VRSWASSTSKQGRITVLLRTTLASFVAALDQLTRAPTLVNKNSRVDAFPGQSYLLLGLWYERLGSLAFSTACVPGQLGIGGGRSQRIPHRSMGVGARLSCIRERRRGWTVCRGPRGLSAALAVDRNLLGGDRRSSRRPIWWWHGRS
jgi:hypothetical protein